MSLEGSREHLASKLREVGFPIHDGKVDLDFYDFHTWLESFPRTTVLGNATDTERHPLAVWINERLAKKHPARTYRVRVWQDKIGVRSVYQRKNWPTSYLIPTDWAAIFCDYVRSYLGGHPVYAYQALDILAMMKPELATAQLSPKGNWWGYGKVEVAARDEVDA